MRMSETGVAQPSMNVVDRRNVLPRISELHPLVLDLGCGPRKCARQAIGIDTLDYECVDIVGDVFTVLRSFPDTCVDSVYSSHFFEHLENWPALLEELARIMKSGAVAEIAVPHFSNPYFYSDPTHRTFFGLYTFSYMSRDNCFSRKVPTYKRDLQFELLDANLRFTSSAPFYGRLAFKFLVGKLLNATKFMKEFYEENLCYMFPCYEIRYRLRKL
jgi:SAM-dependent methyltransferase